VVQGGHDPRRFAADLLDRVRDLIILAAVPGAGHTGLLDAPADRLEKMAGQAGRFGQAELARSAEILSDGLIQMRGTTSPRLLLELMCAQVLLPGASTGEKALLSRLERLERRLETVPEGQPAAPGAGPPAASTAPARPAPAQDRPAATGRRSAPDGRADEDRSAPEQERSAGPGSGPAPGRRPATEAPDHAAGEVAAAESAAASVMPVRRAEPARPGAVDADTLRERWPDVLEAVKGQRRIAWMLLSPASVESLEGNVLTVAFLKEGEAKGFASSGCDQVLAGVLGTLLGLNVRVRAIVGTGAGPGTRGAARSATSEAAGGHGPGVTPTASGGLADGPGAPAAAPNASATGIDTSSARPEPAPDAGGSPGPGEPPDQAAPHAPAATGPEAQNAAGVPLPRGAEPPTGSAPTGGAPTGGAATGGARTGGGAGRRAGRKQHPDAAGTAPAAPNPGFDEEEWPDDAGPAGGAAGPTGMELIQRELGGKVIEELEEP
jgi:DNA polymerase-3 subunit gamma/tau